MTMDNKNSEEKNRLLELVHGIICEELQELKEEFYEINIKILDYGFNITTKDKEKYDD